MCVPERIRLNDRSADLTNELLELIVSVKVKAISIVKHKADKSNNRKEYSMSLMENISCPEHL